MNQRGIWQLILMAREGDRQAIDELFYVSFRPSYLILLTLTGDREKTLDLLSEGYIHLFSSLDEIEQAEAFFFELNRYTIERAKMLYPELEKLSLSADDAPLAQDFRADAPQLHDFDTVKSLDLSQYADDILVQFRSLPVSAQICAFLYYYAELPEDPIAQILSASAEDVLGTLQAVRRAVLPKIADILQQHDAFRGTDAESAVLWALRNTARFVPVPARLENFYQQLVMRMVESDILDTSIDAEVDLPQTDDIPMRDMQPLRENRFLKFLFSFRSVILLLCVLVIAAGLIGIRQFRSYHARRSGWNDFTDRTTLSMTNSAIQLEHYIFSTEYEAPTEPPTEETTQTEIASESESGTTAEGNSEPTAAVITTAKAGADFSYTENGNQVTITGYKGNHATCEVPAQINGKNVTSIGENAFYNSSLTAVKLPSTLQTIGKSAFQNCTGLQSIAVPSGVTTIDSSAFRGCSNLSSVTLPDTLRKLGDQAFYRCTSLTTVTLPNGLQTVGEWAFAYCTNLSGMAIPDSVMTMGGSVFYECKSLTRCTFTSKSRLSTIGDSIFFDCTSLSSFTFPSSARSVPANTFVGCRTMSSVTLSANCLSIGSNAFKDCISLNDVKIPSKVTRIDAAAFQNCMSLTAVTLPTSMGKIGESAFRGCSNLQSIVIPASVKSIGSNAFAGCDKLVIQCPAGSTAEKYADNNHIEVYGRTTEAAENNDSSRM